MIIELHLLQNVAPSCLNRDDTNTPKDAEFGGHRRARISSQCLKRSARTYFRAASLLPPEDLAVRTKRLLEETVIALAAKGRDRDQSKTAVTAALGAAGLKIDDKGQTQYLLFLGRSEVDGFVAVVDQNFETLLAAGTAAGQEAENAVAGDSGDSAAPRKAKKTAKQEKAAAKNALPRELVTAVGALLDGGRAVDLALFGRMLADLPDRNIDAACQVAHAISTNRLAMEMDYFTAVDDLQSASDDAGSGAGMIGNVEFNSSCFYRYANIDTRQLLANLDNDDSLAQSAVTAFIRASVEALPTGKQNSMAAHNAPSLVMAVARPSAQWNLANAFVRPIDGKEDGLVVNSIRALDGYWGRMRRMYGIPDGLVAAVATTEDGVLDHLQDSRKESVAEVISTVAEAMRKAGR